MEDLVKCVQICVDCVENDPVDVRCGGPSYLGFDFFVDKKFSNEMQEYIMNTLNKFNVPCENIYSTCERNIEKDKVWTKERILNEIKKDADYLRYESEKNKSMKLWM